MNHLLRSGERLGTVSLSLRLSECLRRRVPSSEPALHELALGPNERRNDAVHGVRPANNTVSHSKCDPFDWAMKVVTDRLA